jgi:hypothetical protein
LTPTVAVICVVALADCGQIRLKITPMAMRAAAARILIKILDIVRPAKTPLPL